MIGKIVGVAKSYLTGKTVVSIEVPNHAEEFNDLLDKPLDVTLKIHRDKRSLQANGYYWVLCQKLASARGISLTECHNWIMSDYGQLYDGDGIELTVRPDIPWLRFESIHLRPTGKMQGDRPVFQVVRPSHTYDTQEMSRLIDGLIFEAKGQGIETITPAEKERMMATYDKARKRKQVSQSEDGV